MDDAIVSEWKKELKLNLGKVQNQPSADLDATRDRIVVLQKLIGERATEVETA